MARTPLAGRPAAGAGPFTISALRCLRGSFRGSWPARARRGTAAMCCAAPQGSAVFRIPRPSASLAPLLPLQIIAGDDKGAVGEVERVLTKKGTVVVKGVNIKVGWRRLCLGLLGFGRRLGRRGAGAVLRAPGVCFGLVEDEVLACRWGVRKEGMKA
jgi:hypothetical protein